MIRTATTLVLVLAALTAAALFGPSTASAGVEPERLLVYKVGRITPEDAPTIDGRLDDPVWRNRPAISTLRIFMGRGEGEFATQPSEFMLVTDGTTLFIGARFHESAMASIRSDPSRAPFWNDCIELYFDPRNDGKRSIQLVIDNLGQKFWDKRADDGYGWYVDTGWHMLADWRAAVDHQEKSWSVEIAIDLASFGMTGQPGSVAGFNPCRFRFAGGEELTAWGFGSPLRKRQKDMTAWGRLIFAEPGEAQRDGSITMDDVRTIYPDLGQRRFRVPMDGGFRTFSAEGVHEETFQNILQGELTQTKNAAEAATTATAALPQTRPHQSLRDDLAALQAELLKAKATAAQDTITLGQFDAADAALSELSGKLTELMWKARLAKLVLETTGQD